MVDKTVRAIRFPFSRWWCRSREVGRTRAGHTIWEMYVPWWAYPFDWIWRMFVVMQAIECKADGETREYDLK